MLISGQYSGQPAVNKFQQVTIYNSNKLTRVIVIILMIYKTKNN